MACLAVCLKLMARNNVKTFERDTYGYQERNAEGSDHQDHVDDVREESDSSFALFLYQQHHHQLLSLTFLSPVVFSPHQMQKESLRLELVVVCVRALFLWFTVSKLLG